MAKKVFIGLVAVWLLAGMLFSLPSAAMATAVDRLLLCDLEGRPGEAIQAQITLKGTDAGERSGYWSTYYNRVEGDDERMDITSWITIAPQEYTISLDESLVFTVTIAIPADAAPGVWGALNADACQSGHSDDRRTYIIFKDAAGGGNVYTGMVIPVLVTVLGEESPPENLNAPAPPGSEGSASSVLDFLKDNIIVIVLGVIIILLVVLLIRRRARG